MSMLINNVNNKLNIKSEIWRQPLSSRSFFDNWGFQHWYHDKVFLFDKIKSICLRSFTFVAGNSNISNAAEEEFEMWWREVNDFFKKVF